MFTAALFTISKGMKILCPLTDERIKKMWRIQTDRHTYIMQYYSVLKKKVILPFVTTCMNLGDTMLSEISHRQILQGIIYIHIQKKKKSNSEK